MKQQLNLLTIRQQPEQKKAEIPSRTIKAYVKEKLRGFEQRQAVRVGYRQKYREAAKRQPHLKSRTFEHSFMKTIPITYRAIFEQPTGILNPMGIKLPGPQPIEVIKKGQHWYAREISTLKRQVFDKLGKFTGPDSARDTVEQAFLKKLTPWQIWGIPPTSEAAARDFRLIERVLLPDEIADLGDGKAGWYTAEDRTHIIHAPTIPAGARIPPAACGATVGTKCFINNRANVEPSCKVCAEVWKAEYKDK